MIHKNRTVRLITRIAVGFASVMGLSAPAFAFEPVLPDRAELRATDETPGTSAGLPSEPNVDGKGTRQAAEGTVTRSAWAIPESALTTLQILDPIREQLDADGYQTVFECKDFDCGGFDFRFALDLLPEPDMRVDLGDYRYLLAARATAQGPEYVALTISRGPATGYVHVTNVVPGLPIEPEPAQAAEDTEESSPFSPTLEISPTGDLPDLIRVLNQNGRVALDDLVFQTGSSALGEEEFESLRILGTYLRSNPGTRIVLVGHTDASGSLDNNIALSRRRAGAVLGRLAERHNVPSVQMTAEGVGFLVPRAPNATEEGRALNRRVEAVKLIGE